MTTQDIIALGGLLIALVGLITGFILQRDTKKIRELERDNKKFKGRLLKALNAIRGYQEIEKQYAELQGIDVPSYRRKIRKDKQELFDATFLTPGNVNEMMNDLENT